MMNGNTENSNAFLLFILYFTMCRTIGDYENSHALNIDAELVNR